MNERIKELYRQSQIEGYFGNAFDPQRFAELIVQECADICSDQQEFLLEKIIKGHFGVE